MLDNIEELPRAQVTCGAFRTEKEAGDFFDDFMSGNPFFTCEKEVRGRRLYDPQPVFKELQGIRIDRILHPRPKAIEAGWRYGPIGFEIKKSGIKIGGVISQIMEYRTGLFMSWFLNGTRIMPTIFSIFPAKCLTNDIASICSQQNILACSYDKYNNSLKLTSPSRHCLRIYRDTIEVETKWQPCTRKGHRGAANE
jgi:hypothetical protein